MDSLPHATFYQSTIIPACMVYVQAGLSLSLCITMSVYMHIASVLIINVGLVFEGTVDDVHTCMYH